MANTQSEYLLVGKITGAYGIKGWVKIYSYTDDVLDIDQFELYQKAPRGNAWQVLDFDAIQRHGKGLVGHVVGCDDRNKAEAMAHVELYTTADSLPELPQDEYYWRDLIGMTVWSSLDQVALGVVTKMLETGANDVLVVVGDEHSVDQQERLIPFVVDQVVTNVDLPAKQITVDWGVDY